MSRDFEDTEHKSFVSVPASTHLCPSAPARMTGEEVKVSHAAFRLHAFAIISGLVEGNFGFASDDYLSTISAETDLTVVELTAAGLWERAADGYLIHDPELLRLALRADDWVRRPSGTVNAGGPQRAWRCRECRRLAGCRVS